MGSPSRSASLRNIAAIMHAKHTMPIPAAAGLLTRYRRPVCVDRQFATDEDDRRDAEHGKIALVQQFQHAN